MGAASTSSATGSSMIGSASTGSAFDGWNFSISITFAYPYTILSHDIKGADGSFLKETGYSFHFWTAAAANDADFAVIDTLSTRTTPGQSTRAYGGVATDFNNDRYLNLSIVNEDTADVRVLLNQADGMGLYENFLQTPTPINQQASPSVPSDFDRDGNADLVVANIAAGTLSILLGHGDGESCFQV